MPSTMTTPRAQNDMNKNSMTDSANMTTTGARRVSKLIGMDVVNDKDETIGKVDDILIGPNDKATTAVISVGGFLGVGAKLVTLPYDQLQRAPNDRHSLTVPNASKAQLKSMPEYKYGQGA
jgi:sporulation protein YlmC with PRC-barrel domain